MGWVAGGNIILLSLIEELVLINTELVSLPFRGARVVFRVDIDLCGGDTLGPPGDEVATAAEVVVVVVVLFELLPFALTTTVLEETMVVVGVAVEAAFEAMSVAS